MTLSGRWLRLDGTWQLLGLLVFAVTLGLFAVSPPAAAQKVRVKLRLVHLDGLDPSGAIDLELRSTPCQRTPRRDPFDKGWPRVSPVSIRRPHRPGWVWVTVSPNSELIESWCLWVRPRGVERAAWRLRYELNRDSDLVYRRTEVFVFDEHGKPGRALERPGFGGDPSARWIVACGELLCAYSASLMSDPRGQREPRIYAKVDSTRSYYAWHAEGDRLERLEQIELEGDAYVDSSYVASARDGQVQLRHEARQGARTGYNAEEYFTVVITHEGPLGDAILDLIESENGKEIVIDNGCNDELESFLRGSDFELGDHEQCRLLHWQLGQAAARGDPTHVVNQFDYQIERHASELAPELNWKVVRVTLDEFEGPANLSGTLDELRGPACRIHYPLGAGTSEHVASCEGPTLVPKLDQTAKSNVRVRVTSGALEYRAMVEYVPSLEAFTIRPRSSIPACGLIHYGIAGETVHSSIIPKSAKSLSASKVDRIWCYARETPADASDEPNFVRVLRWHTRGKRRVGVHELLAIAARRQWGNVSRPVRVHESILDSTNELVPTSEGTHRLGEISRSPARIACLWDKSSVGGRTSPCENAHVFNTLLGEFGERFELDEELGAHVWPREEPDEVEWDSWFALVDQESRPTGHFAFVVAEERAELELPPAPFANPWQPGGHEQCVSVSGEGLSHVELEVGQLHRLAPGCGEAKISPVGCGWGVSDLGLTIPEGTTRVEVRALPPEGGGPSTHDVLVRVAHGSGSLYHDDLADDPDERSNGRGAVFEPHPREIGGLMTVSNYFFGSPDSSFRAVVCVQQPAPEPDAEPEDQDQDQGRDP